MYAVKANPEIQIHFRITEFVQLNMILMYWKDKIS